VSEETAAINVDVDEESIFPRKGKASSTWARASIREEGK
jgi:hypothetical protein